jgi:hypothetical protein
VTKEAAENIVDLPADSPRTIARLIQLLYTGEYGPILIAVPSKTERLTLQLPEPWKHVWPHTYARHCTQRLYTHYTCGTGCWFDCKNMVCEVHCPPIATVLPYSPDEGPEQLLAHSKIYAIGDKYDVPGLKSRRGRSLVVRAVHIERATRSQRRRSMRTLRLQTKIPACEYASRRPSQHART